MRYIARAQSGSIDEEHVRARQQNPSGSPFSNSGPLGRLQQGYKLDHVDPRMSQLEEDFRFTSLVMGQIELQECR